MGGAKAGLVLAVPCGAFPALPDDELVFLHASEVRGISIPSVRKRLGSAGAIEVGVVIIDGRVVGYVDLCPNNVGSPACVVAALEPRAEMAILGAEVVATGQFPVGPGARTVEYGGRAVPVISAAEVAAYVERLSDSHQAQTPEGS